MGNFKRDKRSGNDRNDHGGKRDFASRGRGFSGRDRGFGHREHDRRLEMHQAVCDSCGENCEVPFRPSSGKPVYCNDCFKKSDNSNRSRDTRPTRNTDSFKEEFQVLNTKLDQLIILLNQQHQNSESKDSTIVSDSAPEKTKKTVKKSNTKKKVIKTKTVKKPVKKVAKKKK